MIKVREAFEALKKSKNESYIGEAVSQYEHALQAAHFAKKAGHSVEVIAASLFHDIGHFVSDEPQEQMEGLGVLHHEKIAEEKLREWGFPEKVGRLVRNHVNAKRYLAAHNKHYYQLLSEASKGTLEFQGGPMSEEEMKSFRADPDFQESLEVRTNDERAKVPDLEVSPLESYAKLLQTLSP